MIAPNGEAPLAVVLAAGVGRRLGDLTAGRPKALLDVRGASLLERALRALEAAGFRDALIVTGHAAEAIDEFLGTRSGAIRTSSLFNPRFAEANNIVSLLAAADALRAGFCLLNSDIVFDPSLLADVRASGPGVWLVVDRDEPLGSEEMKVELDESGIVRRISKALDPAASVGEYIGIVRFDEPGTRVVLETARRLVAAGGTDLYYEDAMDGAAALLQARIIGTTGRGWTEVDDLADYQRAQRVAAELDSMIAP